MTDEAKSEWCWYEEGGGAFVGGFTSRQAAVDDACANDASPTRLYIGTVSDPVDEMARVADPQDIVDWMNDHLNVDGCSVHARDGAREALQKWVREFLCFDAHVVCLDGDKPTMAEWLAAGGEV